MSWESEDASLLYSGLESDAVVSAELKRLQEVVPALEAEVALKDKKISKLMEVNSVLLCNISILFKTAKAEISRKDALIGNLRDLLEKNKISHGNAEYVARKDNSEMEVKSTMVSDAREGKVGEKSQPQRNYDRKYVRERSRERREKSKSPRRR